MGGWVSVIVSLIAIWLLWDDGWILLSLSIFIGLVNFWSFGIMHNYAIESSKRRRRFHGGFSDYDEFDALSIPNWITWINMFSFFVLVVLLIIGIVTAIW